MRQFLSKKSSLHMKIYTIHAILTVMYSMSNAVKLKKDSQYSRGVD